MKVYVVDGPAAGQVLDLDGDLLRLKVVELADPMPELSAFDTHLPLPARRTSLYVWLWGGQELEAINGNRYRYLGLKSKHEAVAEREQKEKNT